MGPLQGSEVKIRGHIIAHGTLHTGPPSAPGLAQLWTLIGYPKGRGGHFGGHLGIPLYPLLFLILRMISLDSSTPKTWVKTPNVSLQDKSRWSYIGYKGAAAVLDAILNYTFLPHIWNVYPSFFKNLLWAPYKDQKSKLGDISLHTGPPSAPGLAQLWTLIEGRGGHFGGHLGIPLYPLLF